MIIIGTAHYSTYAVPIYQKVNIWVLIKCKSNDGAKTIGMLDMLIASHAKSFGDILITNNSRGFNRVDGLLVENWVE